MKIIFLILAISSFSLSQSFWEQTNGPFDSNSTIKALAIDLDNKIFAATLLNGVYASTDNGNNWDSLKSNFFAYAFAINNENHIFTNSWDVVFRSTNNGTNWVKLINGWNYHGMLVYSLYITSNNFVFAGGSYTVGSYEGCIYYSTNNGDNWERRDNGIPNNTVYSLVSNKDDNIFAGTAKGIYGSTNYGENWSVRNNGLTNTLIKSMAINTKGEIFAGTATPAELFRSTDNGNSWTKVITGISSENINCLVINSMDYIYAGTDSNGVLESKDNGENWSLLNDGLTTLNIMSLVINSNGYIFAGTSGKGVYRSIQSTTSISDDAELLNGFNLKQNYPNPFNPKTKISYSISQNSFVILKVYDILGKKLSL